MDLIRIDDNKMKIMLTERDMRSYSLDVANIDYTQSETRRAFRHILDDVCVRTGFDAKGEQIYVQLYPSRTGGCEMFVTKLDMLCAYNDAASRSHDTSDNHPVTSHAEHPLPSTEVERIRTLAFSFDALEHLLRVCRRLRAQAYVGHSAAYHGDEGRYYLLLSERASRREGSVSRIPFSFINEYGTQQNAQAVHLYIREHARVICAQDAIGQLAAL